MSVQTLRLHSFFSPLPNIRIRALIYFKWDGNWNFLSRFYKGSIENLWGKESAELRRCQNDITFSFPFGHFSRDHYTSKQHWLPWLSTVDNMLGVYWLFILWLCILGSHILWSHLKHDVLTCQRALRLPAFLTDVSLPVLEHKGWMSAKCRDCGSWPDVTTITKSTREEESRAVVN